MIEFTRPEVLVLGGGFGLHNSLRIGTKMRAIEAARIVRNYDISRITFSGGSSYWDEQEHIGTSEADSMYSIAKQSWSRCTAPDEIVFERESRSMIDNFALSRKGINESDRENTLSG